MDFMFAEKTLMVAYMTYYMTYTHAEWNKSRIVCVMLAPDPERIRIEIAKQDWIQIRKNQSPDTSAICSFSLLVCVGRWQAS